MGMAASAASVLEHTTSHEKHTWSPHTHQLPARPEAPASRVPLNAERTDRPCNCCLGGERGKTHPSRMIAIRSSQHHAAASASQQEASLETPNQHTSIDQSRSLRNSRNAALFEESPWAQAPSLHHQRGIFKDEFNTFGATKSVQTSIRKWSP